MNVGGGTGTVVVAKPGGLDRDFEHRCRLRATRRSRLARSMRQPCSSVLARARSTSTTRHRATFLRRRLPAPGAVNVFAGTTIFTANNAYTGGTTINGGTLSISSDASLGAPSGGLAFGGGALQTTATFATARPVTLNAGGGTFIPNVGTTLTLAGAVGGVGGLTMADGGTLVLAGASSYSGGTTVNAGTLQLGLGASLFAGGALTVNGGILQPQRQHPDGGGAVGHGRHAGAGQPARSRPTDSASNTTLAAPITGTGGLTKQGLGTLNLTGANTYTGPTMVNGGTLAVNGSLAGSVTVGNGGTLGGNGTFGGLVANGGILAPGNSIGTFTVNGNFAQNGGIYQVEVNAAGQSDRINAAGTATINGGAVQVLAQSGTYARNTTYTILNATGGGSGAYSSVTSNFAFLTPSLSYDANNVYLLLFQNKSAFAAGAQTPNQYAVGTVLDQVNATATGDLGNVLNAMSVLSNTQGPAALNAISGQQYADYGTMNTNNSALFMNALGQQMANARGSSGGRQRQAMAQGCEIEACDAVGPLSAWASALGGLGSVLGDGNASTLTYNFGGAAAGIDYRLDPRFLVGIGTGYTHGTQWVNGFSARAGPTSVSVGLRRLHPGGLLRRCAGGLRLLRQPDAAPDRHSWATASHRHRQHRRQSVPRPGRKRIQARYLRAGHGQHHPLRPLADFQRHPERLQRMGAQSLSLNVAQQTTNSLRTTIGADLAGAIGLGNEKKLDFAVRLGWQHEFDDTGRPITAAFAGAPGDAYTVYAAAPARDSAVVESRPRPTSPRLPRSTCATTAASAAVPTTTPSMLACASAGETAAPTHGRGGPDSEGCPLSKLIDQLPGSVRWRETGPRHARQPWRPPHCRKRASRLLKKTS